MKILVTGGTGSFGQAMTSKLIDKHEVVILSRNEKLQVEMKNKFPTVKYVIGDIRDYNSMNEVVRGMDIVIHAGALKHIDKCELQPLEAIKTNVIGSKNVILACINNKVKKLICLSTDKATNAETTYGSTKFLMERIALDIDSRDTDIVVTRYGNVLGSSGSVIPYFKSLKAQNKPLTVTNRNITRFFMTMDEATDLVQYAIDYGKNKDLIVFNNKSATVGMIADCISDNQIETGLRCVEKTGEALLTVAELNHSELVGNYYIVNKNTRNEYNYINPFTSENAERYDIEELKELIKEL
jgi:UDP-glucose 4-epimerase